MEHVTPTFLATAAGWLGAGGTVLAYWLVSARRIAPGSRTFQGLNAAGAGLLALSAASHQSWPSTTVNLAWMAIGIAVLLGNSRLLRSEARSGGTDRPDEDVAAGATRELTPV